MAVADVAVRIGPRNTRRLRTGAVVLVAIGAMAAAILLIHPAGPAGPALPAHSRAVGPSARGGHLVYAMSPTEVQRLTGAPATRSGGCWRYPTKAGMVGSVVAFPGADAVKLCFLGGALSEMSVHLYAHGHWTWYPWPAVMSGR